MSIRRIAAVAAVAVLSATPSAGAQVPTPEPSPDGGGGGDTTAVAINTRDGAEVYRLMFQIRRVMGDVVDSGNAAVAWASCEDCQTVAAAFQVVLVLSDPSVVTPQNLALAINTLCDSCQTLASAYQFVTGADGGVHFSPEGNQALAQLRRRLQSIRLAELTIFEIQAELEAIATELAQILETEMLAAQGGGDPIEAPATDGNTTTDDPGAGSPAPGASEAPSPHTEPSPTEEPAETPSP